MGDSLGLTGQDSSLLPVLSLYPTPAQRGIDERSPLLSCPSPPLPAPGTQQHALVHVASQTPSRQQFPQGQCFLPPHAHGDEMSVETGSLPGVDEEVSSKLSPGRDVVAPLPQVLGHGGPGRLRTIWAPIQGRWRTGKGAGGQGMVRLPVQGSIANSASSSSAATSSAACLPPQPPPPPPAAAAAPASAWPR